MSNIYDMLGINVDKIKNKKREKEKKNKKQLDFLKENDNLFSIPTSSKTLTFNNKNVSIWRKVKFRNKCRNDGLVFSRWKRLGYKNDKKVFDENVIEEDNSFEKYNKGSNVIKYTDEFYEKEIKDMDTNWTKEETDYLFGLCEKYDCHFIIIHDVYDVKYNRTIEELKHRYYSVVKKVVEDIYDQRIQMEEMKKVKNNNEILKLKEEKAKHPFIKCTYNMEADIERKKLIHRTYTVTKEERMLEETTIENIKQFEAKIKSEMKRNLDIKKLKKKFELTNEEIVPINALDEEDIEEKNVYTARYYFNKQKIDLSYNDSVDTFLSERGIEKPKIYTENICFLYGVLRTDAAILLNLRKKVEKLKQENEFWKKQVASLKKENDKGNEQENDVNTNTNVNVNIKKDTENELIDENKMDKTHNVS